MRSNVCTWGYALLQLAAVAVVVLNVREGALVGAALATALTGALFGAWGEMRNPAGTAEAEGSPAASART